MEKSPPPKKKLESLDTIYDSPSGGPMNYLQIHGIHYVLSNLITVLYWTQNKGHYGFVKHCLMSSVYIDLKKTLISSRHLIKSTSTQFMSARATRGNRLIDQQSIYLSERCNFLVINHVTGMCRVLILDGVTQT